MQVLDIADRVRAKVDDPDGTYCTDAYVMGFMQDVYEWLAIKLRLVNMSFDESVIVLPAVVAGTPDLNGYMAAGQPLATMIQPRIIRWRLPGQDASFFRRADGPLDYIRDIGNPIPQLDSWAWIKYSVKLSSFSTALDLEISGEFLFDPLTGPDSQLEIGMLANRVLASKVASEVGKARGNDKWVTTYSADADEALEDLQIEMVKEDQPKTRRLARMTRRRGASGPAVWSQTS
jgi:hypothetical protein